MNRQLWVKLLRASRANVGAAGRSISGSIAYESALAIRTCPTRGGTPKLRADQYSANIMPLIREIQASGVKSLRGVARALAARGIPTARGGTWTPVQVSAILRRAG